MALYFIMKMELKICSYNLKMIMRISSYGYGTFVQTHGIQINILKSNTHKGIIVSTTNDLKITMNIYLIISNFFSMFQTLIDNLDRSSQNWGTIYFYYSHNMIDNTFK